MSLTESVERVTRAGMEVYAGFIVGFDADGPEIFETQRSFIDSLPVAAAMVGILTALPRTQLWRRLEREGRLRGTSNGDQFGRPNFVPVLDDETLIKGYRTLLSSIYTPGAYYKRCAQIVEQIGERPHSRLRPGALAMALRIILQIGILSPRRRHFWRLIGRALRRPHTLARAVGLAVQGEHFIRYTTEEILPRLDRSLAELQKAPAAPRPVVTQGPMVAGAVTHSGATA
jgi:hypothetical protein